MRRHLSVFVPTSVQQTGPKWACGDLSGLESVVLKPGVSLLLQLHKHVHPRINAIGVEYHEGGVGSGLDNLATGPFDDPLTTSW